MKRFFASLSIFALFVSFSTQIVSAATFIGADFYRDVTVTTEISDVENSSAVFWQLERCKRLIESAYYSLPLEHRSGLRHVKIFWAAKMGRGVGGGDTIYLRCNNVQDNELVGVFIHEMGHITDTGVLQGNAASGESVFKDRRIQLFNDDESVGFYTISWKNTKAKIKGSTSLDFVTGYAMTDPFEDFAETYNFYLLHGNEFLQMAQQNSRLKRKYEFMKSKIFHGKEFSFDSAKGKIVGRDFDSTVISFSLEKFLKNR